MEILESTSPLEATQNDVAYSMEKLSLNATAPSEHHNNPDDVLFIPEDSVTETSSTFETRVEVQRPQTVPAPSQVRYEMESTDEELYLGIFCFFDDLNRLRDFLNDLWTRYKLGTCDLITAAVTTNSALELVHRAEQDFVTSFPKNDRYEKTAELYYVLMCFIRGEDPATRERPDDLLNFNMVDVAEWLFMPVYAMLDAFVPVLRPDYAPIYKPGYHGVYNPRADRSKLTIREQLKEDLIIICESLTDFYLFNQIGTSKFPIADELLDGIRLLFTKKIVPTRVVFRSKSTWISITYFGRKSGGNSSNYNCPALELCRLSQNIFPRAKYFTIGRSRTKSKSGIYVSSSISSSYPTL